MVGQEHQLNIGFKECQFGYFKLPTGLKDIYSAYEVDESNTEAMIRAHPLIDFHTKLKNCTTLTFHYSKEGVNVNYAFNETSQGGDAQNDTFLSLNVSQMINKIYLSDHNDKLKVNMTNMTILLAHTLKGNDTVSCYTPCNVTFGEGPDYFQVQNTTGVIVNFNISEDYLDFRESKDFIQGLSHLTFNYNKSNGTLIISRNLTQIIIENQELENRTSEIKIIYPNLYCRAWCPICTHEECTNCDGCYLCDSKKCSLCSPGFYLQDGKCVSQCNSDRKVFKKTINGTSFGFCYYCNIDGCSSCYADNKCFSCQLKYLLQNDSCTYCQDGSLVDQKALSCKPCGTGCKECNSTHCLKCFSDQLLIPYLSTQRCYLDLKTKSCDQLAASSTKIVSSTLGGLFGGGCALSESGQIVKIQANLPRISSSVETPKGLPYFFKENDAMSNSADTFTLRMLDAMQNTPVNQYESLFKYTSSQLLYSSPFQSCQQSTKEIPNSIYQQDLQKLIQNPNIKSSTDTNLELVQTFQNLKQIAKNIQPIYVSASSYLVRSTYENDKVKLELQSFLASFTMLLGNLGLVDQQDQRFTDIRQTDYLLLTYEAYDNLNINITALQKIGFKKIEYKTVSLLNINLNSDIIDSNSKLILKLNDGSFVFYNAYDYLQKKLKIFHPINASKTLIDSDDVKSYYLFNIQNFATILNLENVAKQIIAKPFQHVKLTYSKDKQFLLTKWTFGQGINQVFTVYDLTEKTLVEKNIGFTDSTYGELREINIYANREFKFRKGDTDPRICSNDEIQYFLGPVQYNCYTNQQGQKRICYEDELSSSEINKCDTLMIAPQTCQKRFVQKRQELENKIQADNRFSDLLTNYPNRTCVLLKLAFIFGVEEIQNNNQFINALAAKNYYQASLALLNSKQSCLLKPQQVLIAYQNFLKNEKQQIPNMYLEYLTVDKILDIMNGYGLSDARAKQIVPYLKQTMLEHSITTSLRVTMFIAECAHESMGLTTYKELGNDFSKYIGKNGNTEPEDAAKYRGRGAIQITGKANYKQMGDQRGYDLVTYPELLENIKEGTLIAGNYWGTHKLNYHADRDDIVTVTKIIQGKDGGLEDRKMFYARAKKAFGLSQQ